jgi:uncharacterized protein YprB with RNaseH-like and TPR domain
MLNESLRSRLELLNRGPLPATAIEIPPATLRTAVKVARPSVSPLRPGLVKPIPGLIRRGKVVSNEAGSHLRICVAMEELWPGGEQLVAKRCELLQLSSCSGSPPGEGERKELDALIRSFPDRTTLLDLETCGLSGSALFLIGLLHRIDDRLTVELLLARDYSEEAAVLASLWQRIHADGVVVTFNGKSFDWPMVVDRSRRHLLFRGTRPPAPVHLDLLHAARRRWKKQLPDCKLQTLERHICGRTRTGDIPGSQIPAAYQQFVRTGFEREMDAILLHNAIDLVTLLDLAMRLAG